MPARIIVYPPERASTLLIVPDGESVSVGRDPSNGLVLDDPRVSRRHAELRWNGHGWTLSDLGSKNGTLVNASAAAGERLADGDWVSFGGLLGRFEVLSPDDLQRLDLDRRRRYTTSLELRDRLHVGLEPRALLRCLLESAISVSETERGFILLCESDGRLRPEIAAGFSPALVRTSEFAGSLGAIEQALRIGRAVVVSDAQRDGFLGRRESVIRMGLSTLACVPLKHDGRTLGFLYVDGRTTSAGLTDLELEILESLAEQAAIVLASVIVDAELRDVFDRSLLSDADRELLVELERRLDAVDPSATVHQPA